MPALPPSVAPPALQGMPPLQTPPRKPGQTGRIDAGPSSEGSLPQRAPLPLADAAVPGRRFAIACAAAVLLIWISFILVARGSARATLTAWDIAWLRFAFSGLVVLPFVWHWRAALVQGLAAGVEAQHATRTALRRALALGLIGGVGYSVLAYNGFFLAPVAHAAVLMPGCLPLWSALGAWLLLGERLTAPRLVGLALILAGGVAVAGASLREALSGAAAWRGDLLFVAASITWALYGVLCRRWRVGALQATVAIAAVALVLAVPAYALAVAAGTVHSMLTTAPWREIVFQGVYQGGVAMLVAGYAFTQVVAHFGPVRTTMFTAIVPPLAALAAVPVLGEPLAPSALVGLACVTLGLGVGSGAIAWRRRAQGVAR